MDIFILTILIIGGLVLFIIEIFLIPGISLAGLASAACLLYAVYFAFAYMGYTAGWIALGASLLGIVGVTAWFMRSKTVDRLALKESIDYRPDPLEGLGLKVGDEGVAITRLTLIGNATVNGHRIEVQSADGFIDEKTPIRICRISNGVVYVERLTTH